MARSLLWFLKVTAERPDSPTDADLLRRFAVSREESAFELLVRRHAPAVWAACRHVLRNDADADDAFQATFLALARHAGSVRVGASLGGWLYRVAMNAALKLRAKRVKAEPLMTDIPADPDAPGDGDSAAVHEELARLSDAYRTTLVLVDLEGHTHADAAKILGWPVGTVSGRLVRARAELRQRLERRGVTGVSVLAGGAVSGSAVRAAVDVAVGSTVASPAVVSLSDEVLAMTVNAKRKLAALAATGLIGLAMVGTFGVVAYAQPKPDPVKADKPKADDRPAAEWNQKGTHPTTIPDVVSEKSKWFDGVRDGLPEVVVYESDPLAVRAAKRQLLARLDEAVIIASRIKLGTPADSGPYTMFAAAILDVTDAAAVIWDKLEQLQPWFEWRVRLIKGAEEYTREREKAGVEVRREQLPYFVAERYKAEVALLKLREKAKK